jgi:uncharacterized peroxidase-related enzyme
MSSFKVHTINSAPEGSAETLGRAEATYGFLPNVLGVMAESPSLLKGYATLSKLFAESSLTAKEQQIVLLTVSRFNGCEYCTAAHSMTARMTGLGEESVRAFRCEIPLLDDRLEALRRFTTMVLKSGGSPGEGHLQQFFDAGFTNANVLDVILGIGFKTLSNTTNHIAHPPIDAAFGGDPSVSAALTADA